jgi:hypothetical protein
MHRDPVAPDDRRGPIRDVVSSVGAANDPSWITRNYLGALARYWTIAARSASLATPSKSMAVPGQIARGFFTNASNSSSDHTPLIRRKQDE